MAELDLTHPFFTPILPWCVFLSLALMFLLTPLLLLCVCPRCRLTHSGKAGVATVVRGDTYWNKGQHAWRVNPTGHYDPMTIGASPRFKVGLLLESTGRCTVYIHAFLDRLPALCTLLGLRA